jgi:hypothetical protein
MLSAIALLSCAFLFFALTLALPLLFLPFPSFLLHALTVAVIFPPIPQLTVFVIKRRADLVLWVGANGHRAGSQQ